MLKFIMSILVTAMHTELFSGAMYPLTRLAVPVFLFLSGYFFFAKVKDLDRTQANAYFKRRIKRLLLLYLFWFVALLPLTLYIKRYHEYSFAEGTLRLIHDILLSSTFQGSWYLMASVIGLCVVYLLSRRVGNAILIVVGVLFYIFALISSGYSFILGYSETAEEIYFRLKDIFGLFCRNFAVSIIYIVLGKLLSQEERSSFRVPVLFFGFSLSFLLLLTECKAIENISTSKYDTDCFIMLVPSSVLLSMIALRVKFDSHHALVLREMSVIVYCLHMPVYMIWGKLFKIMNISDMNNVLVFSVTVFTSLAVALLILRLEKVKGLSFLKYSH